jgi:hypothetical protein
MANEFPPRKDADLLSMADNLSTKISATPLAFNLTPAQATAFAALNSAYATAYATAIDPTTRTKANINVKDVARTNLIGAVNGIRDINRFVQATRSVTDAQKIELGLPVYKSRSPINPPTESPTITVNKVVGRTAYLRLTSPGSEGRGRPAGVQGAIVMSYTGTTPPSDPALWRTEGLTTRTIFPVVFPPSTPGGALVWVTAAWYSPRGQAGPLAPPVQVYLAGGLGAVDNVDEADGMKIAA